MKNILMAVLVIVIGLFSTSSFAKEVHKRKIVVISFSENDAKGRLPASVEEKEVIEAQARHTGQNKALDAAIEGLAD